MIPFKGGSESFTALIGGHLDVYGDPGFGAMASAGKVRLLATITEQRLQRWPNVPTLKESGYDLVVHSNIGLVAPKGLDQAITERLHAAFRKAAEDADYHRLSQRVRHGVGVVDPAGLQGLRPGPVRTRKEPCSTRSASSPSETMTHRPNLHTACPRPPHPRTPAALGRGAPHPLPRKDRHAPHARGRSEAVVTSSCSPTCSTTMAPATAAW